MELLWQDGHVVVQSQNQRSIKKSNNVGSSGIAAEGGIPTQQQSGARDIRSMENDTLMHNHHHHHQQQQQQQHQLFMHEDEMASWLHYPIDDSSFDRDIYSDFLYQPLSGPISTTTTTVPSTVHRETRTTSINEIHQLTPPPPPSAAPEPTAPRPPIPSSSKRSDAAPPPPPPSKFQNFMHFSRLPKTRFESGPSCSGKARRESTVVESNETPRIGFDSRISQAVDSTDQVSGGNVGCGTMSVTVTTAAAGTSTAGRDFTTTCELTVTSSPGGSGGSASASGCAEPPPVPESTGMAADDRKRKGRETDDAECHSEVSFWIYYFNIKLSISCLRRFFYFTFSLKSRRPTSRWIYLIFKFSIWLPISFKHLSSIK